MTYLLPFLVIKKNTWEAMIYYKFNFFFLQNNSFAMANGSSAKSIHFFLEIFATIFFSTFKRKTNIFARVNLKIHLQRLNVMKGQYKLS